MMKCWEKSAKVRPSFLIILDRCENFRRKSYGPGYDNDAFLGELLSLLIAMLVALSGLRSGLGGLDSVG